MADKARRPRRPLLPVGLIVSAGLLLAACATGLVNPQIPPPGPPGYQDGYLDGCTSGFSDAGREGYGQDYRKDVARYRGEPDYRRGWDQGYGACFEEERRTPKMMSTF